MTTASEKLKALDVNIRDGLDPLGEDVIINALPQIVALIEAAEAVQSASWLTRFGPGVKMSHPVEAARFGAVAAALTALEEALS